MAGIATYDVSQELKETSFKAIGCAVDADITDSSSVVHVGSAMVRWAGPREEEYHVLVAEDLHSGLYYGEAPTTYGCVSGKYIKDG